MDGGHPDGLIALRVRDISSLARDRSFETSFATTQPQPALTIWPPSTWTEPAR
jgi:hypothetical protein